jgi:hypothetical protein
VSNQSRFARTFDEPGVGVIHQKKTLRAGGLPTATPGKTLVTLLSGYPEKLFEEAEVL